MTWIDSWPIELHQLVSKIKTEYPLGALCCQDEISGHSGMRTFRFTPRLTAGPGLPWILKVGSKREIADELCRLEEANQFFNQLSLDPRGPFKAGNLSGIVMRDVGRGGKSLRKCFRDLSPARIEAILEQVFLDALHCKAADKLNVPDPMGRYCLLEEREFTHDLLDAGDDSFTLRDWWGNAANSSRGWIGREMFTHGDLHGDNIVVDLATYEPRVVDFRRSGLGHAYRDLAKLERDIWLFVDDIDRATDPIGQRVGNIGEALKGAAPVSPSIKRAVAGIRKLQELAKEIFGSGYSQREHRIALLVQFMFAARRNRSSVPGWCGDALLLRRAALSQARAIRDEIEKIDPGLKVDEKTRHFCRLELLTWQIAYSFLRLDQLPDGPWARTLPGWMDLLWEGDPEARFHHLLYEVRKQGGRDATGYAVWSLVKAWETVFNKDSAESTMLDELVRNNQVVQKCADDLFHRIDKSGAVDLGVVGRGKLPPNRVRHSLIGLLTLLYCKRIFDGPFGDAAMDLVRYLIDNLAKWREEPAHLFGMFASAVVLRSSLGAAGGPEGLFAGGSARNQLRNALDRVIPKMEEVLVQASPDPRISEKDPYEPSPRGTHPDDMIQRTFFTPYWKYWRMERSNALMFLRMLISKDGEAFVRPLGPGLKRRIKLGLVKLLGEINGDRRQVEQDPTIALLCYTADVRDAPPPARDWGLSAELLALLELPVVVGLFDGMEDGLADKREALRYALVTTLADCAKYQLVFRYTHGLSFGAFLATGVARRISPNHCLELDKHVQACREGGVTEHALYTLVSGIFTSVGQVPKGAAEKGAIEIAEMLLGKLAPGDHLPTTFWNGRLDNALTSTVAFFDGPHGLEHMAYYAQNTNHDTLITRLPRPQHGEHPIALDLGCGAGRCASLLSKMGYFVELLDVSQTMLAAACKKIGRRRRYCSDVTGLGFPGALSARKFKVIVANALFVHIPPDKAPAVLNRIRQLLTPDGVFFVNFKINDHSLLSRDGRYFAYYRDTSLPEAMLRNAGFAIEEVALRWGQGTMYTEMRRILWANFYCHLSNATTD